MIHSRHCTVYPPITFQIGGESGQWSSGRCAKLIKIRKSIHRSEYLTIVGLTRIYMSNKYYYKPSMQAQPGSQENCRCDILHMENLGDTIDLLLVQVSGQMGAHSLNFRKK
uniref:Uncharacterized protein n=1 Tax=Romanomermis culicivorax TaxID=13658 RepID=A0A915I3P9_ROMCU